VSLRRGLRYFSATFAVLIIGAAVGERLAYERVRKSAGPYLSDATGIGREAHQLSIILSLALGLNLVLLVFAWWVLHNQVLQPLDRMRSQLSEVATGSLHQIIEVDSPREIHDAAADAERMRRNLVHQLDVAYSAWSGLEQNAPLVTLMRRALEPTSPVVALAGIDVFGITLPASGAIAGDWWDVIRMPDGLAIVVVDIAGHGPEAAILGLQMKAVLAAGLAANLDAGALVNRLSREQKHIDALAATAIIVIIPDDEHAPLEWINAGHPSALLMSAAGHIRQLGVTGPMIGGFGGYWNRESASFEPGDRLLVMTDGILETRRTSGDEFGIEGVQGAFRAVSKNDDSEAAVSSILAKARHESVTWDKDDITLMSVLRRAHS
jgi:serine phosphatase RsbU (regulator of sigma subunit)